MKVVESDYVYVRARCKLLPKVEKITNSDVSRMKKPTRRQRDLCFHRNMIIECISAGLMNPGNLVLFDAKDLPSFRGDTRNF